MCEPSIIKYTVYAYKMNLRLREERAGLLETHWQEFRGAFLVNAGIRPDNLWLESASLTSGNLNISELRRACRCIAHAATSTLHFAHSALLNLSWLYMHTPLYHTEEYDIIALPSPTDCTGLLRTKKDSLKPIFFGLKTESMFWIWNETPQNVMSLPCRGHWVHSIWTEQLLVAFLGKICSGSLGSGSTLLPSTSKGGDICNKLLKCSCSLLCSSDIHFFLYAYCQSKSYLKYVFDAHCPSKNDKGVVWLTSRYFKYQYCWRYNALHFAVSCFTAAHKPL